MSAHATKKHSSRGKAKKKAKFRASWRGQLRFGLVSFGVQAINAEIKETRRGAFSFVARAR